MTILRTIINFRKQKLNEESKKKNKHRHIPNQF